MTKAVAQDTEMYESLDEVALLFDQARTSVFKLMASVSFAVLSCGHVLTATGFCAQVLERPEICNRVA